VFERFTERARQVVVLAQDEARTLKHNYIGTEHILLGLIREDEGIAARVLASLNVTLDDVRAHIRRDVGEGTDPTVGQIPFTPRAKKVLELALREALHMGHGYIGTEHVLLGLVREPESEACRILVDLGANPVQVHHEVIRLIGGPSPPYVAHRAPPRPHLPPVALLVAGWVLFALALGAGILVGWAIWG
jgi:ATP-dependent Clp protease ATP-binding subunit ClpC